MTIRTMIRDVRWTLCALSALFLSLPAAVSCKPNVPVHLVEKGKDGKALSKTLVVTLVSNDDYSTTKKHAAYEDGTVDEPAYVPDTKKGYTFAGWCADQECTSLFDFDNARLDAPITLYAAWSRDILLKDEGKVARVTGASLGGENLRNPNETHLRWNLGGTDLGVIWEIEPGRYGILFGDSYGKDFRPVSGGGPGGASDWRSNVLAFSEDTDLSDGLAFSSMLTAADNPGRAIPVIERPNYYSFTPIPTSAIELDGVQYLHYMYWEVFSSGRYSDGYSSIYRSKDGGLTWERHHKATFAHDSYFGMVGYGKRPGDPYCYVVGTRTAQGYRNSPAKVARFRGAEILDIDAYEYWNGDKRKWVKGKEKDATVVLDGTVGELSLMWLEDYGRWLVLYFDSAKYAICYRSAARVNGPWSEERVLCSGADPGYSQLYGSFIHPLSGKEGASGIFYTMSQWQPYNVFLMRAGVSLSPTR